MKRERGWKHPFYVDTFRSLESARLHYPHVARFQRVWLGELRSHRVAGFVREYIARRPRRR